MNLREDANEILDELIHLRRAIHRQPEVGLQLPQTQEKVLTALDRLPYEVTLGESTTSVTAVLRGTKPSASRRPVVLLRADMDALPVQEKTGIDFTSEVDGVMHACGHDLHTAMLVGAATLLADRRGQLAGDVVLMFQPGEEGYDGAAHMIREGVLDAAGHRADSAFGMHVFSAMGEHGVISTKSGVVMSASDGLFVTVLGKGGHGSAPHMAKDPVTVAAEMITSLQMMITRQFDIFDPVVLTVGLVRAGTQRNVIPETARFEATIRTFSAGSRERMKQAIPGVLKGIACAHGLDVDLEYRDEYPLSVSDEDVTLTAEKVITEMFGEHRHSRWRHPLSGSEDFSRVLADVPGTIVGLSAVPVGTRPEDAAFNHSPFATFDDTVLADGAALYAQLATKRIEHLASNAD